MQPGLLPRSPATKVPCHRGLLPALGSPALQSTLRHNTPPPPLSNSYLLCLQPTPTPASVQTRPATEISCHQGPWPPILLPALGLPALWSTLHVYTPDRELRFQHHLLPALGSPNLSLIEAFGSGKGLKFLHLLLPHPGLHSSGLHSGGLPLPRPSPL